VVHEPVVKPAAAITQQDMTDFIRQHRKLLHDLTSGSALETDMLSTLDSFGIGNTAASGGDGATHLSKTRTDVFLNYVKDLDKQLEAKSRAIVSLRGRVKALLSQQPQQ
jgi:hypothetical protein